ncbi:MULTISPECIES: two-component system response regulator NarL [unclassified Pseudoalteromonas]|uniref:two-component system response regulator NarL n=1 Tax=unclassified Pseudoalteromonas TaxID=194690 RepID=UPI0020163EF7|nr:MULTISPECIES: two-component system response regulator NarL [unclassified Pseudoalteromonas]
MTQEQQKQEQQVSNTPATIMLVDDHPLFRKGLQQLIEMEDDLAVISQYSNGTDAISGALEDDPDLIILDLNMQGIDGLETVKQMRLQGVTARIIMLTVSDNDEDVIAAITNGADGYLLKDMEPEDIVVNIKQAVTGRMAISERLTETLATALRRPNKKSENPLDGLTSRELEILKLIAKGMSNKLIARELDISDGTVKVHVKHVLKKLSFRSRVEAAVWMVDQNS